MSLLVCQGALSKTTTEGLPLPPGREAVDGFGDLGAADLALHRVEVGRLGSI